ncbi:hypothetical protein [Winslowiella iniecta]|uniref:SET domain-containing protein n=1 Tax=Winslowiella iniecta TaxID=1560201 RepID=A0A0L7T6I2_9GAMM|nr:hypothetical protein [Winslowiella iniecta]KOC88775.1 hypothetical protein NG42_15265 [Winslowiella iniecta]KOC91009.1 hypothetical protein NG43_16455 [Winslowiella iniecta]
MPVSSIDGDGALLRAAAINTTPSSHDQTTPVLSTVTQTSNSPLSPQPVALSGAFADYSTAAFSAKSALIDALEEWQQLAVIYPTDETIEDFFLARGVTSSHHYVDGEGLNEKGEKYIENYRQKNQPVERCSLQQALTQWQKLTIAERKQYTIRNFARSRGIDFRNFSTFATIKSGLKTRGKALTELESSKNIPDKIVSPLRNTLALHCWLELGAEDRRIIGTKNFAKCVGVSWSMFRKGSSKFGLSPFGEKFYQKHYGTLSALLDWKNVSSTQRQAMDPKQFAIAQGISPTVWEKYADINGLTELGLALSRSAEVETMRQSVRTWFNGNNQSNPSAEPPIITIKQEPANGSLAESSWEPQQHRLILKMNDAAPLLIDPNNPERSLTSERIQSTNRKIDLSVDLEAYLKKRGKQVRAQFMARANRFANQLINSDGSQQGKTFDKYLSRPLQLFTPSAVQPETDEPAPWGLGIYAKSTIPVLTILGAYAGVLLDSEEQVAQEYRAIGCERSLGYSWTLPADESGHAAVISGFRHTNRLALINTNQLLQQPPLNEQGIGGAAGNNIALMYIGGLILVYVTIKAVKEGQQMLVDYGPVYDPLDIKKESYLADKEAAASLKRRRSERQVDRPGPPATIRRIV